VEATDFVGLERFGGAAGIETSVPKRFRGIDIAETSDARLIEKEFLERALRMGEQLGKVFGGEVWRNGIYAEFCERGAGVRGFVELNAAEMTAVSETEDAAIEFESDVHVDAVGAGTISVCEQFLGIAKPNELAVEFEMKSDDGSGESKPEIFAFAADSEDFFILGYMRELCRRLQLCGNGVEDVSATDAAMLDERAQGAGDGFYFGEFGHRQNRKKCGSKRPATTKKSSGIVVALKKATKEAVGGAEIKPGSFATLRMRGRAGTKNHGAGLSMRVCLRALDSAASLNGEAMGFPSYQYENWSV